MPAQPVDATPSNALIRQCFPGRSALFGCPRSKPSQGSVPADLTLASDLAFVFNASRVRLECCVDPLKPPDLSGVVGSKHERHLHNFCTTLADSCPYWEDRPWRSKVATSRFRPYVPPHLRVSSALKP